MLEAGACHIHLFLSVICGGVCKLGSIQSSYDVGTRQCAETLVVSLWVVDSSRC